jgi:hypothetical protein
MTVTGAKLAEALDEVNDEARSIKFHVVESPFPISNCNTEVSTSLSSSSPSSFSSSSLYLGQSKMIKFVGWIFFFIF